MLGMTLITHQTGPEGREVGRIYVEDGSDIARELYLSALVDRATSRISFIASTEGGMDIEEVAAQTPEKILTIDVDPAGGISGHHGRQIAFALGLEGDQVKQATALIANLYRAFVEKDMSLLEINPLVVTGAGDLDLPRRQSKFRFQCALSAKRYCRAARFGRRRSGRN